MHKQILKYLLYVLLVVLFAAIIGIIYITTIDVNDYKSYIEKQLNKSGLHFKIKGDIDIDIDDRMHIKLGGIEASDMNGILFDVDSVRLSIDIGWPEDTFEIYDAQVQRAFYHFRSTGIDLFETSNSLSGGAMSLSVIIADSIALGDGQFLLTLEDGDELVNVKGIQTDKAYFELDLNKEILKAFQINASGSVREFKAWEIQEKETNVVFEMSEGVLSFEPNVVRRRNDEMLFQIDLVPTYSVYSFEGKIRAEHIGKIAALQGLDEKDFFDGTFDAEYDFNFSIPGDSLDVHDLSGKFLLTSSNSVIRGVNLDKLIKSFRKTQNFNMQDLGSVLLLGPWGLAVSKGGDYAGMAMTSNKDSSLIEYVYCDLELDSGRIHFKDVGFRTNKNRVVLTGNIDIANKQYEHFSYALIDQDGCSEIRQEYNGPFEKAEVKGASNMKILMGPVTNLFKGTSSIVTDEDCEHPYQGKVDAHVKKSRSLFGGNSKENSEKKSKKKNRKNKKKKASA